MKLSYGPSLLLSVRKYSDRLALAAFELGADADDDVDVDEDTE